MPRLTVLLRTSAISLAMIAPALAEDTLTVTSWGGAYTKSQEQAYFAPFAKGSGVKILQDEWDGSTAKLKGMVETGQVTWDVVDVEPGHALQGCDEGWLEKIDYSKLGGKEAFIDGAAMDCAAATIVFGTIYAYDATKFPNGGPTTMADLFDAKKFPGPRALRKSPKTTLEFALIADGVAPGDVYKVLGTPAGVDRAFKKLDTIKKDVKVWWSAGDVAEIAKRLNYYETGMRSMLLKTARSIRNAGAPYRAAFTAIDEQWGMPRYWRILKQAMPTFTDFYLLAALDLHRDETRAIAGVAPENAIHLDVLIRTFVVSASVTVICLLLGYPLAALIARSNGAVASALLILVLLPFWTSLLVRTSAWVVLLQSRGVVNSALAWAGLIDPAMPLNLIYNRIGVLVAMTHILLPFMVLPIYSVMKSIPPVYLRAAASLGAPPFSAFWRVYLPMSMPGVSAGCLLVFILALGYYITPALVGGQRDQMVSYFIAYYANQVTNWGMAAALSAILLVAVLVLYAVYNRLVGIDRLRIG